MLQRFITGVYWSGWKQHRPVLPHILPRRLFSLVRDLAETRWHERIDPSAVTSVPPVEMLTYMARVLGRTVPSAPLDELANFADDLFDRMVATWLRRNPTPTIVHAFEGSAFHSLCMATKVGAHPILDVPSAYENFIQAELNEGRSIQASKLATWERLVQRERNQAEYLLVASASARQCLVENGVEPSQVVIIPYGADPDLWNPEPIHTEREQVFRALYVGQVIPRKGVRYLLEAWRRLELPNAELVIVGGTSREVMRLLGQYRRTCRWLGKIPHRNLPEIFRTSTVFVCPSLAETGPLVAYEAMAAGLPVLLTEPARAVARDGIEGFIVPAREVDSLAERLLWFYSHRAEARAMGVNGRNRIEGAFTWRHYRRRIAAAYAAIAAGRAVQEAVDDSVQVPS